MPKLIIVSLIMEIISRFIIERVDWTLEDGLMLSVITLQQNVWQICLIRYQASREQNKRAI